MMAQPIVLEGHYAPLTSFYVTELGRLDVIIGRAWLKQHGVYVDTVADRVLFRKNHCVHPRFPPTSTLRRLLQEQPISGEPDAPLTIDPEASRQQSAPEILKRASPHTTSKPKPPAHQKPQGSPA